MLNCSSGVAVNPRFSGNIFRCETWPGNVCAKAFLICKASTNMAQKYKKYPRKQVFFVFHERWF